MVGDGSRDAVSCERNDRGIDMYVPVLLWDAPLGRYVMTILAFQIKNKKRKRAVCIDLERLSSHVLQQTSRFVIELAIHRLHSGLHSGSW